uniref:Uncharacterized protein n=1 Tax=Oncorhynchus mykiss TaxID=8022 RepID=A0A8C7NHU1_ONCMY
MIIYFIDSIHKILSELGGQFLGLSLLQLGNTGCGLRTHDTTSPVTTDLEEEAHCHELIQWEPGLIKSVQGDKVVTHVL